MILAYENPLSAAINWPVIPVFSCEQRKLTRWQTSLSSGRWPKGVAASSRLICSPFKLARVIGVSKAPGSTELTRCPARPRSITKDCTRPCNADLVMQYDSLCCRAKFCQIELIIHSRAVLASRLYFNRVCSETNM